MRTRRRNRKQTRKKDPAELPRPFTRPRKRIILPVSKAGGGTLPGVDLNNSADLLDRMELNDPMTQ